MYFRCLAHTPFSKEKFNIDLSTFDNVDKDETDSDSDSDDETDTINKRRV